MDPAFTHTGSRNNLLGPNPSQALVDLLSNEKQVTARTPPAFLVHTKDDAVVPYRNAVVYDSACRKAGVPVEFRSYDRGPHGFGLADGKDGAPNLPDVATWPGFAGQWMERLGFFQGATSLPGAPRGIPAAAEAEGTEAGFDALGRRPPVRPPSDGGRPPRSPRFPW